MTQLLLTATLWDCAGCAVGLGIRTHTTESPCGRSFPSFWPAQYNLLNVHKLMHSLQRLQVYNILVVSVPKTNVRHKNRKQDVARQTVTVTSAHASRLFYSQFNSWLRH